MKLIYLLNIESMFHLLNIESMFLSKTNEKNRLHGARTVFILPDPGYPVSQKQRQ